MSCAWLATLALNSCTTKAGKPQDSPQMATQPCQQRKLVSLFHWCSQHHLTALNDSARLIKPPTGICNLRTCSDVNQTPTCISACSWSKTSLGLNTPVRSRVARSSANRQQQDCRRTASCIHHLLHRSLSNIILLQESLLLLAVLGMSTTKPLQWKMQQGQEVTRQVQLWH